MVSGTRIILKTMPRKFHGPCAKSIGDSTKNFLRFRNGSKTCSLIQAADAIGFCFSINVVKTCSHGIKFQEKLKSSICFVLKHILQVNISYKLSKFL